MGVSDRGLLDFVARLRPPSSADSDGELLDRFVKTADDDAFAGLVRRHGPMVLAVCRRRLGRDTENEDAFQAVFLTLANSARSLSRGGSLAGWLYRVAYLIALRSANRRSRRRIEGTHRRCRIALFDNLARRIRRTEVDHRRGTRRPARQVPVGRGPVPG